MNYIKVSKAAEKWGISARRVRLLCANGKIDGVIRKGNLYNVSEAHTKIELNDELVKACQETLGFNKGRFTACVKQEICRCIKKNISYSDTNSPKTEKIKEVFDESLAFISNRKVELENHPDKFRKLQKSYKVMLDRTAQNLINIQ